MDESCQRQEHKEVDLHSGDIHVENENAESRQQFQKKIGEFREFLPQFLAACVKSLVLFNLGMMMAFPTIVIPALMAEENPQNLHFDANQASWYGGMLFIFQPIGSLLSGVLLQPLGCIKLLIIVNIPEFLGCWILSYFASSTLTLFVSNAISGLMIGLMEAPTIRFLSEISHPSLRGTLTTFSGLFLGLGMMGVFFVGSLMSWRETALISAVLPIITVIALFQLPETPMWLVSKGRPEEALKSLQWLRGWTSAENVKEEMDKLKIYRKTSAKTVHTYSQSIDIKDEFQSQSKNCSDTKEHCAPTVIVQEEVIRPKKGLRHKWRTLTDKKMLVPLCKCNFLMVWVSFAGLPPIRPFLIIVFQQMEIPMPASWATVLVSLAVVVGNLLCIILIRRLGKRFLLLFSALCVVVCLLSLVVLEWNVVALKQITSPFTAGWILQVLISLMALSCAIGLQPIPWVYPSEILPFKNRGIGAGIVASVNYLSSFIAVKTFLQLTSSIGLHGTFLLYAIMTSIGFVFAYFYIPETEGLYLADIEAANIKHAKDSKETTS